jgi:hypothetical protein
VAALDAQTGSINWLTTYPRVAFGGSDPDRNDLHFQRDLNPCLVYRDLVIVAPLDCDRQMALDATTGVPIWTTRLDVAADAVHLLGVCAGNVIVSGDCLYWLDAADGRLVGQFPGPFRAAPGFARPLPRGCGRGMLAGKHIYWPTRDAILVFPQQVSPQAYGATPNPEREIPLARFGIRGGNLAASQGMLLVASDDRLVAFGRAAGTGPLLEK